VELSYWAHTLHNGIFVQFLIGRQHEIARGLFGKVLVLRKMRFPGDGCSCALLLAGLTGTRLPGVPVACNLMYSGI